MNISELARKLRTTTAELFVELPKMGFDIGRKAIKVDDRVAENITRAWNGHRARMLALKQKEEERRKIEEIRQKGPIKIPAVITVRDFAAKIELPVNKILAELMKNGIVTSLNEKVDFATASILAEDLGIEVFLDESEKVEEIKNDLMIQDILNQQSSEKMESRPPVVVIMGHVDHGKTKLLDAIRDTHVIEGESGGITQHIGAYQAWATPKGKKQEKKILTFIDTPGHEAFTAMRSRGAKIADIAVLVVAADDGVMPQTVEAYKIIQQAKLPVIVAINKIDKPEANLEKVKQDLAGKLNLIPEDWGGPAICVPISAKEKTNLDQLLEMILLVAEMNEDKIKANPDTLAAGTIIEAHVDKGEGPVATMLVQNGLLKVGEYLVINNDVYGKIKAMKDFRGSNITQASPSMPVKILGLKISPRVGDIAQAIVDAKVENRDLKRRKFYNSSVVSSGVVSLKDTDQEANQQDVNIILKADMLGSLEAIVDAIQKIEHPQIKINIITRDLGNINEVDILRAESCAGLVIGFHALPTSQAKSLAISKNIEIKTYNVIYDLLAEIKARVEAKISPEIIRKNLGKLKVLAKFREEKDQAIIGGKVIEGLIKRKARINLWRDDLNLGEVKLLELKSGKEVVNEVDNTQECGLQISTNIPIEVGDILEFFIEEKKSIKL